MEYQYTYLLALVARKFFKANATRFVADATS